VLFAGAYAWLCVAREIARPLVAFAATGKSLAFLTFVLLWLLELGPAMVAAASIGDALLACVFLWWLAGGQEARRDAEPELARKLRTTKLAIRLPHALAFS
jgi:hypothetical protein